MTRLGYLVLVCVWASCGPSVEDHLEQLGSGGSGQDAAIQELLLQPKRSVGPGHRPCWACGPVFGQIVRVDVRLGGLQTGVVCSFARLTENNMILCLYINMEKCLMRTTIDLPGPMFRRLKSTAALRGMSMKALIIAALEREIDPQPSAQADEPFPVIRSRKPGSLQLDPDRTAEILEVEDVIGLT